MTDFIVGRVPVVIIGAGPTGVTAASLLASYGVESMILDRWNGVYPQPRAVHMDDEVCRIVARLGIADQFRLISRPGLGLRLVDANMHILAEFARDDLEGRHGFPQANMFDQPDFEEILRVNLARIPCADLRGNVEVTDIDFGPRRSGGPRVKFTDRNDRTEHLVHCDYLLGCDGANSITRDRLGVAMRDLRFAQRWLVIDVATDHDLGHWDGVHQVCSPQRAGTFMRIGQHRYRWEFRLLDDETAADFATLGAVRRLIHPWVARVDDEDIDLVRVAEYTFRAQIADRWRVGNTFLLGDSAHLTPPFIGQGMGAGLRDAMNLSWKLAGVINGDLPEAALDSYEVERKPHAQHMIAVARGMGWAMTAGGETGNLVRRAVVPHLNKIPGLRSKIVDSATPALRRSALIHKRPAPRQLAGSLAPNPILPDGRRLDALLGNGFGLITAEDVQPDVQAFLGRRGATAVAAEPGGELARWLGRGRVSAAIIRPDRVVMRAGRLEAMCAAIPRFHNTTTPQPAPAPLALETRPRHAPSPRPHPHA